MSAGVLCFTVVTRNRTETAQGRQGPSCLLPSRFASLVSSPPRYAFWHGAVVLSCIVALLGIAPRSIAAQTVASSAALREARLRTFLAARSTADGSSPALARLHAQSQQATFLARRNLRAHDLTSQLGDAWQPLGPSSIVSALYGNLTGRVTAIALDPNDGSGNTVYLGTTGGGVWKSTNAAGPLSAVTFAPLTDRLPVFNANAGSSVIPSLSIGAVSVQPIPNPVILAGTGDPNDATDSLYGEGLLRSTDGGLTWTLITDSQDGVAGTHSFAGLATAAFAWSTVSPTLVVAALSTSPQSAIVSASNVLSVPGLYYSTDAGVTWHMSTIYDGSQLVQSPHSVGTGDVGNAVTSVVWDAQYKLFFAAVRAHGYYSSSDGVNWTRLTNQPGTGLTVASCPIGVNGIGSGNCPIFRGTLAVQPVTGDLYALTIDALDKDQGLWQDLCNASPAGTCANPTPTWGSRLDNGALEAGPGDTSILQGSYDLGLAASPSASGGTLLFAGTVDLYRCSLSAGATGCSLRNTTNALNGCNAPAGVAPSQHAIVATQTTGALLVLVGNDGGLWRSTDGVAETGPPCSATDSQHFDNLNTAIGTGGSLAQIVGFAQDPGDPDVLLAGMAQNGSAATTNASNLAPWPQLAAGEGGFPQIDPVTPTNWFLSIGAAVNLKECALGAACTSGDFLPPATIGEPAVDNDVALLDAPSLLDPQQTTSALLGTCRAWRGTASSGSDWTPANAISPAFDGSGPSCSASSALVRSLAAGGPVAASTNLQNAGSTVLYAGIAGWLDGGGSIPGHLFVTKSADLADASIPWTDISTTQVTNDIANAGRFNPGSFDISSIVVDPHDASGATVYATVMGFGVPHVYRSTDFGASWLNITRNLPSSPANAIVVDPNDANTVYVALDSGVYVTQAVTTCTTTNCWNILGSGLPNAPVTALAAAPNLATGDGHRGLLRAGTYGRGLWQIPLLTASTLSQPDITLSASSFTFSAQQVSTESVAQTLAVTSSGNAPVIFGTPAITGDFVETDTCTGQTLAVGASCTVEIRFAPAQTGNRSGLLTLYANISGGQATVALSGVGTAPAAIVLTPPALDFPATIVNQTAPVQNITVSNTGDNPATLQPPSISGDFAISANTCGTTLPAKTGCTLSITFTPTAGGPRGGILSLTDSAGTQTAQLNGTGNAPATDTLSPSALVFAQQAIGSSSAAQQVTLTNNGDVALTLISATVSPGDFSVASVCGNSLTPHSSCVLSVAFIPTQVGMRTATLTVQDQVRAQTISLTGTGIAPPGVSLSPSSLSFPATGVGLTAAAQTLTLTNNGGLPLNLSKTSVSSGFLLASSTCGSVLAPQAACQLIVVFAPTQAAAISGTLTLTDDAPSGSQTVNLSGTGIDFALTAAGPTSATIKSGSTATYPLLLSSSAGLPGTAALSCSGAPANSVCTVTPSMANLGGTVRVSATVQTGVATQAGLLPSESKRLREQKEATALFALLLLPMGFSLRRKRVLRRLLPLVAICFFTTLTGCGASRTIPLSGGGGGSSSPTPAGTYTLTVSASSAGLTRSVPVSLTVQ